MQCLHRWCGFKHGNVRDIFRVFFIRIFPLPACVNLPSVCCTLVLSYFIFILVFFIRAALIWRVQISAFACLLASLLGRDVLQGTIFRSFYRKKVASHLPAMVYTLQYKTMSDGNRNLLKISFTTYFRWFIMPPLLQIFHRKWITS